MKSLLESQMLKRTLIILGAIILLLIVFKLGEVVGFHKARFSYELGEHYYGGVFGRMHGPFPGPFSDDFAPGHGTFGSVIALTSSTLTIEGQDGIEKTIILTPSTVIKSFRDTTPANDLKEHDEVIVIGSPDDKGEIRASLIRVMPTSTSPSAGVMHRTPIM